MQSGLCSPHPHPAPLRARGVDGAGLTRHFTILRERRSRIIMSVFTVLLESRDSCENLNTADNARRLSQVRVGQQDCDKRDATRVSAHDAVWSVSGCFKFECAGLSTTYPREAPGPEAEGFVVRACRAVRLRSSRGGAVSPGIRWPWSARVWLEVCCTPASIRTRKSSELVIGLTPRADARRTQPALPGPTVPAALLDKEPPAGGRAQLAVPQASCRSPSQQQPCRRGWCTSFGGCSTTTSSAMRRTTSPAHLRPRCCTVRGY